MVIFMGSIKNSGKDFKVIAGRYSNNGSYLNKTSDVVVDKTGSGTYSKNGISSNIKADALSNNNYVFCLSRFNNNDMHWKIIKPDLT
jgi:hypothetical protein